MKSRMILGIVPLCLGQSCMLFLVLVISMGFIPFNNQEDQMTYIRLNQRSDMSDAGHAAFRFGGAPVLP